MENRRKTRSMTKEENEALEEWGKLWLRLESKLKSESNPNPDEEDRFLTEDEDEDSTIDKSLIEDEDEDEDDFFFDNIEKKGVKILPSNKIQDWFDFELDSFSTPTRDQDLMDLDSRDPSRGIRGPITRSKTNKVKYDDRIGGPVTRSKTKKLKQASLEKA
ncbi:uncharacterized protein LOC131596295 [Vicia villosa]|uniref:uncharacterized protein LOC131596295 n=1 Tax=Vicia villosa TaxID=3911 RepID=UPI00273B3F51|nr:uncharacterized protein LOC131596295 [Vicia villosa]